MVKSGEPSKFIGRGALQLTGKNNYKLFSDFIGEDCVKIQIWLQLNTFFKVLSSLILLKVMDHMQNNRCINYQIKKKKLMVVQMV
jgi:predicted chitinase